jgi:hypothetical protein
MTSLAVIILCDLTVTTTRIMAAVLILEGRRSEHHSKALIERKQLYTVQ